MAFSLDVEVERYVARAYGVLTGLESGDCWISEVILHPKITLNAGLGGGRLRAFHTAKLPLDMRLVSNPTAEDLSRQIAGAWAAFARNGNPNHTRMPRWEPYSLEERATMIFDAGRTALTRNPAKNGLALLAAFPKGFPFEDE